jgi:hypothetical protein
MVDWCVVSNFNVRLRRKIPIIESVNFRLRCAVQDFILRYNHHQSGEQSL